VDEQPPTSDALDAGLAAAFGPETTADLTERPGTRIGKYKLLQHIGEGGMGVVFMAEQLEPVQRKVALKVIKPGMDTHQVVARFEAERQALALMDHPNIAKVLDAGATDSGRPYFVMELVKGVPITKYCDEHRLTPRQRLELFVPVCHAVQHAHQKGIIHRDLKPSNVLIALYDGRPVPKVIDFGVAKATGQKLTEKTFFTDFGVVVGTLEYMSPEQAELNQLDIDTRSDIYALGVILYELLTGTTPLERKRLRASFARRSRPSRACASAPRRNWRPSRRSAAWSRRSSAAWSAATSIGLSCGVWKKIAIGVTRRRTVWPWICSAIWRMSRCWRVRRRQSIACESLSDDTRLQFGRRPRRCCSSSWRVAEWAGACGARPHGTRSGERTGPTASPKRSTPSPRR
jgi:serine/threonine protein kinase